MREKTYRIGEAADMLHLKSYVLRFWETEFPQLAPLRTDKGQRLYTDYHIALLHRIRHLLHEQGMTIEGARRVLASSARVDLAVEADASALPLAAPITAPLAPPSAGQQGGYGSDFQPAPAAGPTGEGFPVQPERQPERWADQQLAQQGHYAGQQAAQQATQQATQAAGLYAPQPPASPVSSVPPSVPQGHGNGINRTVVREMREELLALRTMLTSDD